MAKERGTAMTAEEVRAFLDGRKTMLRVPVKPQPNNCSHIEQKHGEPSVFICGDNSGTQVMCPLGVPGDRIWVKEPAIYWTYADGRIGGLCPIVYQDDPDYDTVCRDAKRGAPHTVTNENGFWKRRSASQMPRSLSRHTLEVVAVRAERLNEISSDDARAEGVELKHAMEYADEGSPDFILAYKDVWESKHGLGTFDSRWVWAITTKIIEGAKQ